MIWLLLIYAGFILSKFRVGECCLRLLKVDFLTGETLSELLSEKLDGVSVTLVLLLAMVKKCDGLRAA